MEIFAGYLANYGDEKIFRKYLAKGFTEVAFGRTKEPADSKDTDREQLMRGLFAFYGDNKKIATYEHRGSSENGQIKICPPVEKKYSAEKFNAMSSEFNIELSEKRNLAEVINVDWKDAFKYLKGPVQTSSYTRWF